MALLILLHEVIKIKTFYITQGQNSMFKTIKIEDNICKIYNLSEKANIKKVEKTVKKMHKANINAAIISRELHVNTQFINMLNIYDITVFDGKWLGENLILDLIHYLEQRGVILKDGEVSILANDLTENIKGNVKQLSSEFKRVKIITNHEEKFRKLESDLYNQTGIPLIISNNKKKSLLKSKLIINFDFVEEEVNKYNINENAIIISLNDKVKINKKRFNGIIITDYEVKSNPEFNYTDLEEEFYRKEIYEGKIYNELCHRNDISEASCSKFEKIRSIIKESQITIETIYGTNGIITLI